MYEPNGYRVRGKVYESLSIDLMNHKLFHAYFFYMLLNVVAWCDLNIDDEFCVAYKSTFGAVVPVFPFRAEFDFVRVRSQITNRKRKTLIGKWKVN